MSFLNKLFSRGKNPPELPGELPLLKVTPLWCFLLFSFSGGLLFSVALPPLNLSFAGFAALAPLVWCAHRLEWKRAALCGWVWGLGWALFSFQFLREIEWIVPYLLAPVLALWPAVAGALISLAAKGILYTPSAANEEYETKKDYLDKRLPWHRVMLFILFAAAAYTLIEWTRSRLFTWNDLSITQYRNLPFLQICSVTGSYGVLFLTALGGAALGCVTLKGGKLCLIPAALLIAANWGWGEYRMKHLMDERDKTWSPALIQGDLSQRRHAGEKEFKEALETYISMSYKAAELKPSLIIWPESAVPIPLRSAHPWGREFAQKFSRLISDCRTPMIIGALDFVPLPPDKKSYGITNSALYFSSEGLIKYKYDKIHRVPYGEYIPFRGLLPGFLIRLVDMGRDLTPGTLRTPLELPGGPKLSTAICYEGVFGYLTRDFARRRAEVLLVLSNDAWYPRSSEPEQHLANALMRAIETGLPMLRCGNNGGSGVVNPDGTLSNFLDVPDQPGRIEIKRGRAMGIVPVKYRSAPEQTFYVRNGEWFIVVLAGIFLLTGAFGYISFLRACRMLPESSAVLKKTGALHNTCR